MIRIDARSRPIANFVARILGVAIAIVIPAVVIEHVNRRAAGAYGIDQVLGIIDSPRLRGRIRKGHSNECEDDAAERSS